LLENALITGTALVALISACGAARSRRSDRIAYAVGGYIAAA
jgi:hypothetical protein